MEATTPCAGVSGSCCQLSFIPRQSAAATPGRRQGPLRRGLHAAGVNGGPRELLAGYGTNPALFQRRLLCCTRVLVFCGPCWQAAVAYVTVRRRLRLGAAPPIAAFHTEEGEPFAIDDTCTHHDDSLADGDVEGCWVECPLHASRFDLRTGSVDAPPAQLPVRIHEVKVVDGDIIVRESGEAPSLPPGLT